MTVFGDRVFRRKLRLNEVKCLSSKATVRRWVSASLEESTHQKLDPTRP